MNRPIVNRLSLVAGTAVLAVASSATLADQREDSGLYIGGAYGAYSVDDSDFNDDDTAPQIFAGVQFNPYVGVEAAYLDFGSSGNELLESETEGYSLALTGRLPLTQSVAVYGKIGQFWWDSELRSTGFQEAFDGQEPTWGGGLSFQVAPNLDFRLAYDRLDVDLEREEIGPIANGDFDSKVDLLSAGLKLEF